MFPTESLMYFVTCYTYEAGIACVLYGKQSACKTTKTNKRSYPYITQRGENRECDPCQYIANIKDKTVTGYKYLDLSDAAASLLLSAAEHAVNFACSHRSTAIVSEK